MDQDVRKAVTEIMNDHARAAEQLDPAAAAEMFAVDARMMLPGMPDIIGRDKIRTMMKSAWEEVRPQSVEFDTEEVYDFGEMAVSVGRYEFELKPKDGPAIEETGRFMLLWKKDDGGVWRVYRDLTNNLESPPTISSAS